MMIDVGEERLLPLQAAANALPGCPHISTLHRWRMRGVRGVLLETCLIGGKRYTSREALLRFVEATTFASNSSMRSGRRLEPSIGVRPPTRAQRDTRRSAAAILDRAKI
ncbi:MAG: DUF1580 domain-containing protein [Planctomycetaceae bacterium]|nr:DUF1580 domain-containing protein [Planctomycetaceae bacterium]